MKKLFSVLFALAATITMLAQSHIASGVVVSADDGEPLVGATVLAAGGTGNGVATDLNGRFSITLPEKVKQIVVSYVGKQTKTVDAGQNLQIALVSNETVLNDVVVVAYGTAQKNSLTGAVAQVKSDDIQKRVSSTVTAALEGAAPGVQVNNTYGEPGTAPNIRIRGFGSIQSNTPLYVVDGVVFNGNIAEINPSDVESISVLKDAASSALYGNRASSGVVLITTKSGKNTGNVQVTLTANYGSYNRGIPEYSLMDPYNWMETAWKGMRNYAMTGTLKYDEAKANAYATANLYNYVQNNIFDVDSDNWFDENGNFLGTILPGYLDDLNWQDAVQRHGNRQEYSLSTTASGDKYSVFSSVGYLKEEGYVLMSNYERYTGRINTTFNPKKWFKTGLNLSGTSSKQSYNSNATGSYYINPFYITRNMAPVYPVHLHKENGDYDLDENGEKQIDTKSTYLSNRNIVYELLNNKVDNNRLVLDGQAYGTFVLPYGFDLTVKGNLNKSNTDRKKFDNPNIGDGATNNGRLTFYAYNYTTYTAQELLNWSHEYGVHHVDALVGHENFKYKMAYNYGMNTGMAVDGNLVLSNFLTNSYLYGYSDKYTTESYLARARYNYDQRYFLEGSFRRDGSSRFAKENRWGNFFSIGGRWNITGEQFMKNFKWVDFLNLRASYGEVGNDAGVDYYGYQALYYIDKNGGNAALIKQTLSADEIKWETSQTFDVAIEGSVFDRLRFNFGYFDRRSKDLLFAVRLPLSAGSYFGNSSVNNLTQYKNIGTISNRGFELSLDADIVKTRDWLWTFGVDATFLKNKIIKLPDGNDILNGTQNYSEGHSIYEWYTYHFVGVDQMTGRSLYTIDPEQKAAAEKAGELVTINDVDYTTSTTYGLRDWAGTALPSVYGSITSGLSWKNLHLDLLFTYSLGGKTYDSVYQTLMSTSSASSASSYHVDLLNAWNGVPEGMTETSADRINPTGIPAVDFNRSSYSNSTSDRWLTSSSYFVFKNVKLTYTLPKKWVKAATLNSVSVNVGAENLFTLTSRKGLNPQYSFNGTVDNTYVTARIFNAGLVVNF